MESLVVMVCPPNDLCSKLGEPHTDHPGLEHLAELLEVGLA